MAHISVFGSLLRPSAQVGACKTCMSCFSKFLTHLVPFAPFQSCAETSEANTESHHETSAGYSDIQATRRPTGHRHMWSNQDISDHSSGFTQDLGAVFWRKGCPRRNPAPASAIMAEPNCEQIASYSWHMAPWHIITSWRLIACNSRKRFDRTGLH